jgi:hypothetical protein
MSDRKNHGLDILDGGLVERDFFVLSLGSLPLRPELFDPLSIINPGHIHLDHLEMGKVTNQNEGEDEEKVMYVFASKLVRRTRYEPGGRPSLFGTPHE